MPTEYTNLLVHQHSIEDHNINFRTHKGLEGLRRAEKSTPYLVGSVAILCLSCITLGVVAISEKCGENPDFEKPHQTAYLCKSIETISSVALPLLGIVVGAFLYKHYLYR